MMTLVVAVFFIAFSGTSDALSQIELLPQPSGEYAVPPSASEPLPPSTPASPLGAPTTPEIVEDLAVVPATSPTWYNPVSWIGPQPWEGSIEFGLNGTEGNAESLSLRTGFDLGRETERTKWDIDFTYAKTQARGIETQHNALLNSKWDWKFSHPRWSLFTNMGLEYDEFRNFDLRWSLNSGLGYYLVQSELTKLKGRFGAGSSREFGGVDDEWKPEAVLGADLERQLTERQKLAFTTDYFPTWDDFSDYRLVTDASWQLVLDAASNLSLKLGIIDRYDSTPNGAEPNDLDYSALLLWKL